jgi:two-component system, OmpR family, KDP operon response regulator KdpE
MCEAKILVVADDPILGRAIRTVLSAKGYQVTSIDSCENALQFSCSGKYDLVLVDDDLYEGATVEVCKAIRSVSEIPVIVMNGDAHDNHGLDALREIVNGQLKKPFGVSELFACLQGRIEKSVPISAI